MPALRTLLCALATLSLPLGALARSSGVQGVAPSGEKGQLHVVAPGDTLWGITERYLGTPWIWPSIWKENATIPDPNRIYPGDLIWITNSGMRKVSREEAEALTRPPEQAPAAPVEPLEPDEPTVPGDPFATLDGGQARPEHALRYPGLEAAPFVSTDELAALGSVLGTHADHHWISQSQRMIVSLGEGRTQVGDRLVVFRERRGIWHPQTRKRVGSYVEIVGRAEITEVHDETSYAQVIWATSEIEPGDRLMPAEETDEEIVPTLSPASVEGVILALRPNHFYGGAGELVMLDRGIQDGLARGSEFVVYRSGELRRDPLEGRSLQTPDDVLGRALVVKLTARSAVALLTQAHSEIHPGDRYRSP